MKECEHERVILEKELGRLQRELALREERRRDLGDRKKSADNEISKGGTDAEIKELKEQIAEVEADILKNEKRSDQASDCLVYG